MFLVTGPSCVADIASVADDLAVSDIADIAGKPICELGKRQVFVCAMSISGMSAVIALPSECFFEKHANDFMAAIPAA